MIENYRKKLTE